VPYQDNGQVGEILREADGLLAAIPAERPGFSRS
jgi:hypothetical protein